MRAVIHPVFGEPRDVLEVAERPLPEPGAGEVRVRTLLSPIHNHDLSTIRGTYGFRPELPAASGTEAVGIVDALGEGVDQLTVLVNEYWSFESTNSPVILISHFGGM